MTPLEILTQSRRRFEILLIQDEEVLRGFVRDALEFYSIHAGVLIRRRVERPELAIYPPPLSFNGVHNKRGEWCMTDYDNVAGTLFIQDRPTYGPWQVTYFVNLRNWDLETPLPADLEFTLLIDYVECLIGEANAQKLALSKWVANLESMESRGQSEYQQQRATLEEGIRSRAIMADFAIL